MSPLGRGRGYGMDGVCERDCLLWDRGWRWRCKCMVTKCITGSSLVAWLYIELERYTVVLERMGGGVVIDYCKK